MKPSRTPVENTLIAGIGNIFMGDDAFGCEVAQRLAGKRLPDGVDAVDFGIRGMDLAYALSDGRYDLAILVDSADSGDAPGTLRLIEPELDDAAEDSPEAVEIAPHDMHPDRVLDLVRALGRRRPRVLLLACQPAFLGGDEGHMGLSPEVAAAIPHACREILSLLPRSKKPAARYSATPQAGASRQQRRQGAVKEV